MEYLLAGSVAIAPAVASAMAFSHFAAEISGSVSVTSQVEGDMRYLVLSGSVPVSCGPVAETLFHAYNHYALAGTVAITTAVAGARALVPHRIAVSGDSAIATVGLEYTLQVNITGAHAPYTASISQGSLPPGLSMDASGAITGTPTTEGVYRFSVKVDEE